MKELLYTTFLFVTKHKTPDETNRFQNLITDRFEKNIELRHKDFLYLFFYKNQDELKEIDLIKGIRDKVLDRVKITEVTDLMNIICANPESTCYLVPLYQHSLLDLAVCNIKKRPKHFIGLLLTCADRYEELSMPKECRRKSLQTILSIVLPKRKNIDTRETNAKLTLQATYCIAVIAITMFKHHHHSYSPQSLYQPHIQTTPIVRFRMMLDSSNKCN